MCLSQRFQLDFSLPVGAVKNINFVDHSLFDFQCQLDPIATS